MTASARKYGSFTVRRSAYRRIYPSYGSRRREICGSVDRSKDDSFGDAVLSGNGGIDVFNSNRNEEGTVSAQVEITGGRIETKDFPVSGNNQESAGAEVAITGGSLKNISGGTAIYWPMEGQLTIGGNAVIEAITGSKQKWEQITTRIMRSSQEAANGKKKSRKTVAANS